MSVGILLPQPYETDVVRFVEWIESLGYASFWTSELWGADALVHLGVGAATSTDLKVGTAIVNVFSRTPATLAMAATTIAQLADDRAVIGLGVSTPRAIEGIHGMAYDRPLRRLRETVELIHRLTSSADRVTYNGTILSVDGLPALERPVPVYAAALGEKSRELTGAFCDGWLPHNIPYPAISTAFEAVERGAHRVGREPDDIVVSPHLPSAVCDDITEARALLRNHIAYYVGSGDGYRRAVALSFPERADQIATAWKTGDRNAARSLVTREMIDAIGLAATPAEAPDRLAAFESTDIVDEIRIVTPTGTPPAIIDLTINTLAPTAR